MVYPSANTAGSTYAELLWSLSKPTKSFNSKASPENKAPATTSEPIPAPSQPPPLYALLIGINNYQYVNPLSGCVADAEAAKAYLEHDLAVPSSQITLLLDAQATRAGIIAAFGALAADERIQRDDPIVIFFAGHGDEIAAPEGWEAGDDKIQMIIPQDYCRNEKWGPVVHGIPDCTIGALLEALANEKGDNISVIFDCCHSGSGSRNFKDGSDPTRLFRVVDHPRDIPLAPLPSDVDKAIRRGNRATTATSGLLYTGLRSHVLLAACSAKELAPEVSGRGVFSKELFNTLSSIGADKLTYTDVLFRMHALPQQNPQCEGYNQKRILFNAKAPSRGQVLYEISLTDGVYVLSAGNAHGITEEAQFSIYVNRASFGSAPPLGILVVYEAGAFTSKLKPLPNADTFSLETPGVALQTLAGVDEDLRLYIAQDKALQEVFEALLKDLQRTDSKRRRVSLVDRDKANFDISIEEGKVVFDVLNTVVTQYGFSRIPYTVSPTAQEAYPVIRAAAEFNWHLKRTNKTPLTTGKTLLRDKIRVEFYRLETSGEVDEDYNSICKAVGDNLNVNGVVDLVVDDADMFGIKIINDTGLALFPSLFFFDNADLSITSYYEPPTAGRYKLDPPLRPKKSLTVGYGAGGAIPFNYFLHEGQNVEVGFLKLFFSTEPVDLSDVAQASPFIREHRGGNRAEIPPVSTWDTIVVALVQRKAPT